MLAPFHAFIAACLHARQKPCKHVRIPLCLHGCTSSWRAQRRQNCARSPPAALLTAIDGLNGWFGRHTMRLTSGGFGQKTYDTRCAFTSPLWTTRIDQVPVAR
ncbi:DUF4113 domain-containing protein [Sphingomonas paucimobilis]|uniref:DUF4113 domain-containing protein n=1 Tax=Sphingomonas paucimobilis TaxID=13689 RepID=UPI0030F8DED8